MRLQWIAVPALIAGLLTTVNIALADQFALDGSGVPECGPTAGPECEQKTVDSCTKWTIVSVKIGTETVISRQCSERTVTTTYRYWPKY